MGVRINEKPDGWVGRTRVNPYVLADFVFLRREDADKMREKEEKHTELKLIRNERTSSIDLVDTMVATRDPEARKDAATVLKNADPSKLLEYALRH